MNHAIDHALAYRRSVRMQAAMLIYEMSRISTEAAKAHIKRLRYAQRQAEKVESLSSLYSVHIGEIGSILRAAEEFLKPKVTLKLAVHNRGVLRRPGKRPQLTVITGGK